MIEQTCTLDLGGLIVELHYLPGHMDDYLIALLPEHGTALMADAIETPFPVAPQGSNLSAWIEQLSQWEQVPAVTCIVPCHGPMGGREIISQTIDYLERLKCGDSFDLPVELTLY